MSLRDTFFSDGSKFSLHGSDGRKSCQRGKNYVQENLDANLKKSAKRLLKQWEWVFQRDNDPEKTAKYLQNILQGENSSAGIPLGKKQNKQHNSSLMCHCGWTQNCASRNMEQTFISRWQCSAESTIRWQDKEKPPRFSFAVISSEITFKHLDFFPPNLKCLSCFVLFKCDLDV